MAYSKNAPFRADVVGSYLRPAELKQARADFAAGTIDAAGLKGAAIGGASVSAKHANFIVTAPGATAADVRALIDLVRAGVSRASGIVLQTEVRTIGGPDV